jgi:predicted transcriptional regulator
MWMLHFDGFHDFMHEIKELIMFNTLKEYPEGLTFYDLQKIGNIPHSKIYRGMKKLEEQGYLRKETIQNKSGRPKYLYFLIEDKASNRIEEVKSKLKQHLAVLGKKFPHIGFDQTLLSKTFKDWQSPLQKICNSSISDKEKYEKLSEFGKDLEDMLKQIEKIKAKLLKQIDKTK